VETPWRREKKATLAVLAVLTLAGLGLRVGYAVEQPYSPPPDAGAYARIAENLAERGSFDTRPGGVGREVQPASAYAPGLPLLTAAVYWLSGGSHLTLVLVLLALIGAAAVPLTYLLARRLAFAFCSPVGDKRHSVEIAGLAGAAAVAVYPALLQYQGLLLTEPLAATLLAGSLVAYFRAADRSSPWRWALTGALLGLLTLVRPEYLTVAILLPLICLAREVLRRFLGRMDVKTAAPVLWRRVAPVVVSVVATVLVLLPWTVRNEVVLGRLVPVSTGGGKALYVGTYLGAGGDGPKLRELLLEERPALRARLERGGALDDPHRFVLERVLDRVAAEEEPGKETDAALGALGRSHLEYDLSEEPERFAEMLATKAWETWTEPPRAVMRSGLWRVLQLAMCALALAGLALLARRWRWLETFACGLVLLYMTAIGAFLIASPRRELVVVPLLAALAGVAVAEGRDSLARRWAH
jgi:hypothetical protein